MRVFRTYGSGCRIVTALCLGILVQPAMVLAEGSDLWNIKADQFQCLLNNVDAYLATGQEPVVIFLTACPETDLVKIMASTSRNLAVSDVKTVDDSTEQPAEVVTFTKAQLACLAGVEVATSALVLQVPKDPCR
jgi:uncharacterized protein YfaS (alpha-2-macroglobulin family)